MCERACTYPALCVMLQLAELCVCLVSLDLHLDLGLLSSLQLQHNRLQDSSRVSNSNAALSTF